MAVKTFSAADFATLSGKVLAIGRAADKAETNAAPTVQAWAIAAIQGIRANALTLDGVSAALIAAMPKSAKATVIGDTGNSTKGRFYALQRIVKAGDPQMDRVIAGEAFNTVARSTATVQKQAAKTTVNGKPVTPKATPAAPVPVNDAPVAATPTKGATMTLDEVATLIAGMRKRRSAKSLAENDQAALSKIMADVSAMIRAAEAHVAGKVKVAKAA